MNMKEDIHKAVKISKQIEAVALLFRIATETNQIRNIDEDTIDCIAELIEDKATEVVEILTDEN